MSVVIPTLNRSRWLCDTVREVLAQDYRPIEILIVDQSDERDSAAEALATEHPDLISYHHVDFRGLPIARNFGWRRARHEIILYLDDDIRCYPDLISEHVRSLSLPGVGIVGGGVEESRLTSPVASVGQVNWSTGIPTRGFEADGEFDVDHAPGGNFSAWRRILEECGGVEERMNVGAALYEETELCLRVKRLGYRIVFNGRARIMHLAASNGGCRVPDLEAYMEGMAHNRMLMVRKHLPPGVLLPAFFRLLVSGVSLSLRQSNWRILKAVIKGGCRARAAGN